jgi:lycopene beta-cyclase
MTLSPEAGQHDDRPPHVIIVGGGLSGSLMAWRLRECAPGLRLRLLEGGGRLGGNHTWSFFETDLTLAQGQWIDPLVSYRWPAYEVRFPKRRRVLATGYRSITSERLHDVLAPALGGIVTYGANVVEAAAGHVRLKSGEILAADCVLDARGARALPHLALGYQKFCGLEVRLSAPHGLVVPIIMDATVRQEDGYRFVYTLPLDPHRLLIEDTYYSNEQSLAPGILHDRIRDYARAQGWTIVETLRQEAGVLPIILAGDIDGMMSDAGTAAPRIGLAAALFHPTTGYSLPEAIRLADVFARAFGGGGAAVTSGAAHALISDYGRTIWRERAHFRLLNRMLFHAGQAKERYRILERFYGLDLGLIQRFYASRLTLADQLRVLTGKPPVSILSALGCVSERRMLQRLRTR